MLRYFFVLFCNAIFGISIAQTRPQELSQARWSLKFSPLGIAEFDQAVSLATEFRPVPQVGLQLEGSYIFNTVELSSERKISNTAGFRVVPELRYYDIYFKNNLQRYLGLQLSYKQVSKEVEAWTSKPNYSQLETHHLLKRNFTASLIAGLQNHAHRIGFDFNMGLGLKYKQFDDLSRSTNFTGFDTYMGEIVGGYYPQLSGTFKICVKIL
jgi:hypothetical protein